MGIAITPDGTRAYVADMGSFLNGQTSTMVDANTVTPIDLSDRHPMEPIVVGPGVGAISITPDGKQALVAIDGTEAHPQSHVEIMNLATGRLSAPISVGAAPMAIAITPNGREALVTDTGFSPLGHSVTPIDLSTDRPERSISVGTAPIDIILTPNGRTAFVANAETARDNAYAPTGVVTTIDVATNTAGRSITVPGVPQSLAITPDGKTVYEVGIESFNHSALAPIDVATGKVGPAIQFDLDLGAVAIARAPRGFCG
jgi:DNA-binding beta-propeller fold protein YncE